MKRMLATVMGLVFASTAWAQNAISIETLPPSVIKTQPTCGDAEVDASITKQISVTFSKDMLDGNWSWTQVSDESFPKLVGSPRYSADKRTCVVDVELQPNKTYVIWLNSKKFGNFKDTGKQSAVPYLLVFKTK